MKKLLLIILFILVLVAAFLFFSKEINYTQLVYFVPKDAVYLMETDEPIKAWEKLSTNPIWQHLQTQTTFAEVTQSANSLDSLLKQNKTIFDLLGSRKVLISAHLYRPTDYDFLFVADLAQQSVVVSFLEKYISSLPMRTYQHTERKFSGYTIHELKDKATKEILHLAFVNNALLASWQGKLVENAIQTFEAPEIGKNPYFTAISQKVSDSGMFRFYLQYSYLDEFMRCYTPEDNEYVVSLSQTVQFTGLDCDIEEDSIIQMKGFTNINDSVSSYFQALAKSGTGKISAFNVIPQRSSFFMSLGFSDFKIFFENFKSVYQQQNPDKWAEYEANILKLENFLDIKLDQHFMSWVGEEVAFVQTQPKGLGKDNEIAVVITSKDVREAVANLDFISEQIRKKTPVKFRELEYNGFTIKYMAVKGFFKLLFGKFFAKLEKPYYTIIGDYVIFSNHPQTIKDIINDYNEGQTLAKSKRFDDFFDNFSSSGNVFTYVQTPVLQQTMRPLVSAETWKNMQTNRDYIQCFEQVGFQLIGEKDIFETQMLSSFTNPSLYPQYFAKFTEKNTPLLDTAIITIEAPLEIVLSDLGSKKYTENYPDGRLKVEVELKNGQKHGTYKEYYPNGEIKIKGEYRKDLQDGIWRYYDEAGKQTSKRRFRNGEEI
jgi:hypothetical protein